MERITVCVVALILGVVSMCLPTAFADGAFVWHRGADLYEPSQKAVISHLNGVEDLILQVKYAGPASDFCWIVPLPAAPKITAVEKDVFSELSLYTQKRRERDRKQGRGDESGHVEVIDRKKVGVYDTAVLKGNSSDALIEWLSEAGFLFPKDRPDVLRHYVMKKWVFAAIRIHPKELSQDTAMGLREGTIQPLLFTFPAKEIVYPLRISSLNAGETKVLLYVLAERAVWHPWFSADKYPQVKKNELPKCRAELRRLSGRNLFLTKMRARLCPTLMSDDIIIRPSPSAEQSRNRQRPYSVDSRA